MTVPHRRPVIVGVDGSPTGAGALRWAADEAVHRGLPLHVVHVVEAAGPAEETGEHDEVTVRAATEARHRFPGLPVTTATWRGEPARVLAGESRAAGLVVVGSRGAAAFHSPLVGAVGTHLAGHAHCPLLVVPHAEQWARPDAPLPQHRPVVVGADGSAGAEYTLGLAFGEAADRDAPLTAVSVWQEPEHRWGHAPDPAALDASVTRERTAELQPWRAKYPEIRVELRVRPGPAAPVLLEEARDALMIVLGGHGGPGVDGMYLGLTSQQVLEHAPVPVLVARHG